MDEDQLYVNAPPYRPRPVTEMVPANPIGERLAQLPTQPRRGFLCGTTPRSGFHLRYTRLIAPKEPAARRSRDAYGTTRRASATMSGNASR
jgi:hypothetical protein